MANEDKQKKERNGNVVRVDFKNERVRQEREKQEEEDRVALKKILDYAATLKW